jgi:quinol monooxygenase YgiN
VTDSACFPVSLPSGCGLHTAIAVVGLVHRSPYAVVGNERGGQDVVRVGFFIRLEVKAGHQEAFEAQLRETLSNIEKESDTVVWLALRLGPTTFAVVDAFPHEAGRQVHLEAGRDRLAAMTEHLAGPPTVVRTDVIAAKLPSIG